MDDVFRYIDRHFDRFVDELMELCRIPSVSAKGTGLEECAEQFAGRMREVGLHAELLPLGEADAPPIVYGRLDVPGAKRTLLFYGHYDVQPAEPLEAWESPPFEPEIRNGRIYGRGTSDNKGQFYAHLKAVEAFLRTGHGVPMNIRMLLDSQEELGSPFLPSVVEAHRELFQADFCYVADAGMVEGDRPTVYLGNRGSCYLEVKVRTAARDVHSGTFGGAMPNAAWRLVQFLHTLRDGAGRVAIKGFYDEVLPPSEEDRAALAALPYDERAWRETMGISREEGPPELGHFERLLFQPTLTICGLRGGHIGPKTKTVIPSEASAKIDMRLVKNQTPSEVLEKFIAHARGHGFDDVEITPHPFQYHPSKTPVGHPMVDRVVGSVREIFGEEPVIFPVSGGSNPGYIFREKLGLPAVMVPYATHDESSHAPNENLSLEFLRKGMKLTAKVLTELASI